MNQLVERTESVIINASNNYKATIDQYKWPLVADSQLHAAKLALMKNDYIMKIACGYPQAVQDALIKSAVLGLDLTDGKRQGWLVPRKSQIKDHNGNDMTVIVLQVGYKGVEAIHQEMGVIDRISISIVRKNDNFYWSGNDQDKPKHEAKPSWFASEDDRGPIDGVFSVTYFPDKSYQVMVASISEVFVNHRDISDSWKSHLAKKQKNEWHYPPVWETNEKAMVEKTMIYIASKQWPANNRNKANSSKMLEVLHETDIQDYKKRFTVKYSDEQKKAFDTLIETKDSLGFFLFGQYVGRDIFSDLFSSFQDGKKTSTKDFCRKLSATGVELFNNITVAIDKKDSFLLAESIDGANDFTIALVKNRLERDQVDIFLQLQSEVDSNEGAIK